MRILDPIAEFDVMRREFERVFDTFRNAAPIPARYKAYPLVNIAEDADGIQVEALAPGLDPARLTIAVVRNQLTIAGVKLGAERDTAEEPAVRGERQSGEFTRTFTLPTEIAADRVSAEYKNGVIRIHLPKAEAAKPRTIAVSVA